MENSGDRPDINESPKQEENVKDNKKKRLQEGEVKETYQMRKAKRIAAHQKEFNSSKSRIRDDGVKWRDAHQEFTQGDVAIVDDEEANMEVTWEDISYDTIREASAKQMLLADRATLDSDIADQYRNETSSQWNRFYSFNKQNFFKDRNYLGRVFQELVVDKTIDINSISFPSKVVMEAGSGVGNSLFPLMDMNPDKFFYAFDCSPKAIDLLREQPRYDTKRCRAFVCDITREDIPDEEVAPATVDYVTMIFMLSAVPPDQMDDVLRKINRKLKIGGMVLFRDYGMYDMTQMRFYAKKTANKLGENFYRRGDGTFSYFFSLEVLEDLFKRNGFDVVENNFETRLLSNRKRKIKMYRVWAQCKFIKVRDTPLSEEFPKPDVNSIHIRSQESQATSSSSST